MDQNGYEPIERHDGTVGGMDREIGELRARVESQSLHITLMTETVTRMDEAFVTIRQGLMRRLQELQVELACRCDAAYTSRGRHEPNAFCHLDDSVRDMLALLS